MSAGRIVIVSGGHDYTDWDYVYHVLDGEHKRSAIRLVVEGGAEGVDEMARDWARMRGIDRTTCWANWVRDAKAGGPIRNSRMLKESNASGAIILPGNRGTADMYDKARRARIELCDYRTRR